MNKPRYDVFLSYNSKDKVAVEELARRLKESDIKPWLDSFNLIPGEPWQQKIEEALNACESYAIFIGPSGVSPWQHEEMQAAINKRVNNNRRVIPVLLPGADRGQRSSLPMFLVETTWVEFRNNLDDENTFYRLVCGIKGVEPVQTESIIPDDICPYPGLSTFKTEDAPFFFGRAALTEWLLDKLRPSPIKISKSRFLAIIGDSGSGKSSLVRAGLIPALKRGDLNSSNTWLITVCRPGSDPVESLVLALSAQTLIPGEFFNLQETMRQFIEEPRTLHWTTSISLQNTPESQKSVIVIDQFEEVFTLCRNEQIRSALIKNLQHASNVPFGRTLVVVTIRTDFFGKCAAYPELAAAVSDNQVLVAPMTGRELRLVIERPAQKVGCQFEAGLVELLQNDIGDQAGRLPLLQHTLRELWNQRIGRCLTIKTYKSIGGLGGALEKHANQTYVEMDDLEKEMCQWIFLRLIQPGLGVQDTKRLVARDELGQSKIVENVLQILVKARLITAEVRDEKSFVEISHEALINGWPKLRAWVDSDREALRTQHRLTEATNLWKEKDCLKDYLLQGIRLAEAEELLKINSGDLNKFERQYLKKSIDLRDNRERKKEEQRSREEKQRQHELEMTKELAEERRKQVQQRTMTTIISSVLAIITLVGLIYAKKAEKTAADKLTENYWISGVTERDHNNDPLKASHYFIKASQSTDDAIWAKNARFAGTFLVRNARLTNISGRQENAKKAIISSDGLGVLTWSQNGSVREWNSQNGLWLPLLQSKDDFKEATFSNNQQQILIWSDDLAQIWDIKSQALVRKFDPGGRIEGTIFSKDDKQILTWTDGGTVKILNSVTGQVHILPLSDKNPIIKAAFLNDRVIVWMKNRMLLWDLSGNLLANKDTDGELWKGMLNQDKSQVLTVSVNGTVNVWDSATLNPVTNKPFHFGKFISDAIFSPTSARILIWGSDGRVHYWDYKTSDSVKQLLKLNSTINGAVFSRDGQRILIWNDGMVQIVDNNDGKSRIVSISKHRVLGASFDRDENRILVWRDDNTVRVWDSRVLHPLTPPMKHNDQVELAKFTPDQQFIITWSHDQVARLWDIHADGQVTLPMIHKKGVKQAAFIQTTHTQQIVTLDKENKIHFWNSESGKGLQLTRNYGTLKYALISPDGHKILTWDDTVAGIWDVQQKVPFITLGGNEIHGATFSHDSSLIFIWNKEGEKIIQSLSGVPNVLELPHEQRILGAVFSQDNRKIFYWTDNGVATIRDARTGNKIDSLSPGNPIKGAVFTHNKSSILFWRSGESPQYWNYLKGQDFTNLLEDNTAIDGARFGPGDRLVLIWNDNSARIWDSESEKFITADLRHEDNVVGAIFDKSATKVLTWSKEGTIRVWYAKDGRPLTPALDHKGPVNGAVISQDGQRFLTWSDDGTARLWRLDVEDISLKNTSDNDRQIRTGSFLDDSGELKLLSHDEWKQKYKVWSARNTSLIN